MIKCRIRVASFSPKPSCLGQFPVVCQPLLVTVFVICLINALQSRLEKELVPSNAIHTCRQSDIHENTLKKDCSQVLMEAISVFLKKYLCNYI